MLFTINTSSPSLIIYIKRFLPSGPVALLPLNENKSSLVWTVSKHMAKDMVNMDEEMFVSSLNKALISEENESAMVNSISEGFGLFLNTVLPKQGPSVMLPPTVKGMRKLAAMTQDQGLDQDL